ncbi:MAG: dual CXXC motif small (seleno)protein [Desulfobacterales bacterium]
MSCRSCRAEYPLEKFADLMDDYFEQELANIPCNRL